MRATELTQLLGRRIGNVHECSCLQRLDEPVRRNAIGEVIYASYPMSGISLVGEPNGVVDTIQLFGVKEEEFSTYTGELPIGLSFGQSKADVHRLLERTPMRSSDGRFDKLIGKIHPWEIFELESFALRVEYSDVDWTVRNLALSLLDRIAN